MSVTRTALCTVKGCPAPRDPDWHVPWCGHGMAGEHQHVPKRSQGGKTIVAFLCHDCHEKIDSGPWGNAVKDIPGRGKVYFAWDLHGKTLIERSVLSAAAEGGVGEAILEGHPTKRVQVADVSVAPSSAAALSAGLSTKEESDGQSDIPEAENEAAAVPEGKASQVEQSDDSDRRGLLGGADSSGSSVRELSPDSDSRRGGELTHEQRVAIAQEIKNAEWNRQWIAGDTGNQWIAELGEEAEQYLSDFGYVHESLANILRVCAAIPLPYRNGSLRFSHHVVVYQLPREDQVLRLKECEIEGWSVAEFRRQVKGTKPKVKKWSLEELWAKASEFGIAEWVEVQQFLEGLEEQG